MVKLDISVQYPIFNGPIIRQVVIRVPQIQTVILMFIIIEVVMMKFFRSRSGELSIRSHHSHRTINMIDPMQGGAGVASSMVQQTIQQVGSSITSTPETYESGRKISTTGS